MDTPRRRGRRQLWPLYAAGFTTAFGAHGIAATIGTDAAGLGLAGSVLYLGLLLAIYDGAEVILKPVFGSIADRVGARPVLLGGLVGFAAASALFLWVDDVTWLWLARLGQGAAASAFSPAASSLVARMVPPGSHGGAFGTYGFYKSIGYTLGPLLGGLIVFWSGLMMLFAVMALLASVVAVWAAFAVPHVAPLPRARQTVVDLARRLADASFLRPTLALALCTAALSAGVGFLPVSGSAAGMGPIATGAAVSVLALCAALAQPLSGRAYDAGRLTTTAGISIGLAVAGIGLFAAMLPGAGGVLAAAVLIGTGTGLATPLAFTALAATTPVEHLGQTMGAAELGRELGDAGGPLLVAAAAAIGSLTLGYAVLGALTLTGPVAGRRRSDPPQHT